MFAIKKSSHFYFYFKSKSKHFFIFRHQLFFHRCQLCLDFFDSFFKNSSKFQSSDILRIKIFRNMKNIERNFDDFLIEKIDFVNSSLLEIYVITNCFEWFQRNENQMINVIATKEKKKFKNASFFERNKKKIQNV